MALLITEVWCWSSHGAVLKSSFEASEKAEKCRKLCKMAFSPFMSVSPWQQRTCKQMFEHILGNYDILPLLCECKMHELRNFEFSENLRPI